MTKAFRRADGLDEAVSGSRATEHLTRSEQQILQIFSDDKTNREIAQTLIVEVSIVKSALWNGRSGPGAISRVGRARFSTAKR
ncbi:MAG: hypothetical protein R3300_09765 [Candidatus Promineifilaceae bacterium]|nr:hypothetical protein [Candidatus Promineifilaceae bacterium]